MELVQVITLGVANVCLKPRLPPKSKQPLVDFAAFKDLSYTFFACGMFWVRQQPVAFYKVECTYIARLSGLCTLPSTTLPPSLGLNSILGWAILTRLSSFL
jgi:hypothetical protein